MSYLTRLFSIAVAASFLLSGCVFAVDHETESEDSPPNDEDPPDPPDPTVSIDGPDDVLYVDADDFSVDYQITCEPEGCEDDLQCRIVQGEADPDFEPCGSAFAVTDGDVEEGVHTVEVQLFDEDEVRAEDAHTTVLHFEMGLSIDGLSADDPNYFSHPHLDDFTLECAHPHCEIAACGWTDGVDSDYDPDSCIPGDSLKLEIPSGTAEATFTVSACARPPWPGDDLEHCTDVTYHFQYTDPVWLQVDTQWEYSCGILDDHTLWCWGSGDHGKIGLGDGESRDYPTEPIEGRWRHVSLGREFACAITVDDELHCWGRNDQGEATGEPTSDDALSPFHHSDHLWKTVSVGWYFACGITRDEPSHLLCWGPTYFDLPDLDTDSPYQIVEPLEEIEAWRDLSLGQLHACTIAEIAEGPHQIYCWGPRGLGRLGDGKDGSGDEESSIYVPQSVLGLPDDYDAVAIDSGEAHNCAVINADDITSQAYCWGQGSHGRLGHGEPMEHSLVAVPVVFDEDPQLPLSDVQSIATGTRHSCATVTYRDEPYCWGRNFFGVLGELETLEDQPHPVAVDFSEVEGNVATSTISTGNSHNCAISDDGTLLCWGDNNGQLGHPTPFDPDPLPTPTPVHWPFAPE